MSERSRVADLSPIASTTVRDHESAPDAIVVGAGHNGLVAANLLADAGWHVVVCEATPNVGGAVQTAEVTAPGFRTDLFSAFYPLGIASPVLAGLNLDGHGLRWTHAPAVLAHVFPDDRCAVLHRDRHRTADSLSDFEPDDGAAWLRLVTQWEQISGPVLDALFRPFPPLRPMQQLIRRLGVADSLRFARMAVQSVRRFGEETFRGEGGRMLLAGNAMHADVPPDGAGSAIYGWLLSMLAQTHGFPVPVGGAGHLIDALVNRLRAAGGTVRTDAQVDRVRVVDGCATGVRLRSGETLSAARAVLADISAPALYGGLVSEEHVPARLVADMRRFQWDYPTLKINWAVSRPIPWIAQPARLAGTVHLGVDVDGIVDFAADLATRRMPRRPFVLLGQMTTADPTRSPAGTESAWAYTHMPSGLELDTGRLQAHVDVIEQLVERHAPGFRQLIVGRYIQTPSDFESANPSLLAGAINGGTAQLHQQLIFRPTPGLGGAATPIDRLFLASCSAHPGGGVHGAPGANAARAALARSGAAGRARRALTVSLLNRIY
jgi:phytoene dehydrogenase-like protein